jgi:hypothetical protein
MLQTVESLETLADLLKQLGDVAPERVRFRPLPGTAREQDVLDVQAREDRLCELVDGVLVEKGMGFRRDGPEASRIFCRWRAPGVVCGSRSTYRRGVHSA